MLQKAVDNLLGQVDMLGNIGVGRVAVEGDGRPKVEVVDGVKCCAVGAIL